MVEHSLSLSHLDKIFWPKEKYTKETLIEYYRQVASYILPYLKNRPIMLHRFPEGIEGKDFYQKDISFSHPSWIKTCSVPHEDKLFQYLLINDVRSLLYAVNLGSIEFHPFMSTCRKLEKPTYCVIDLDPLDVSFENVIEVALAIHALLEEIKVQHYCKTSGAKGLHIFIPLHGKYAFEQSRQFAEVIALHIHQQLPKLTSLERDPKKRQGMVYLDCLQNRYGQTIVAPYSVRPQPGARVSTPLLWEEVKKGLNPADFTIKTILERLRKMGDLFCGVLTQDTNLKTALCKM